MDELFPKWPTLFFDFVLPSGPKHPLLNLWIADPHISTPLFLSLEDPEALDKGASNEILPV